MPFAMFCQGTANFFIDDAGLLELTKVYCLALTPNPPTYRSIPLTVRTEVPPGKYFVGLALRLAAFIAHGVAHS
jgi:hypothetical protein